jgi:hypothetical protein
MMAKFTFPKGSQRWGHYQNKDPRKAAQLLLCLSALTCCFYRSWTKINVLGQTENWYQYHAKSPHTECNPNVGFDQPNPKKKKNICERKKDMVIDTKKWLWNLATRNTLHSAMVDMKDVQLLNILYTNWLWLLKDLRIHPKCWSNRLKR